MSGVAAVLPAVTGCCVRACAGVLGMIGFILLDLVTQFVIVDWPKDGAPE